MAKMPKKQEAVEIQAPNVQVMQTWVYGTSPLIVHRFSDKARKMIEDKQAKRGTGGREKRDPQAEFEGARYKIMNGKKWLHDAIKTVAFKHAMVSVAARLKGLTGTVVKQGVHIVDNFSVIYDRDGDPAEPMMHEDFVRVASGVADLRYRPIYEDWRVCLTIEYNADFISGEQILNLLEHAGFSCGVGDNRPNSPYKTGPYGRFTVVDPGGKE